MRIQSVNLINFGIKKITNRGAYKKQIPAYKHIKTPQRDIFEPYYNGKDYDFDKLDNKKIITISADGNVILSKESDFGSTALELIEHDGKQTKTTRFKISKKSGEKSNCSYKVTENGKSKIISMDWNFPGKNYNYKGSPKDIAKLKKALQHLRNTIHEKEYADNFGYIKEINFQFKTVIGYLQDEISNQ